MRPLRVNKVAAGPTQTPFNSVSITIGVNSNSRFLGFFLCIFFLGIRQLQCVLLKVALLLGVEVHDSVTFEALIPPPEDQSISKLERTVKIIKVGRALPRQRTHLFTIVAEIGWKAKVSPADHPVSQYEFDVLIGADGKRNTLEGL